MNPARLFVPALAMAAAGVLAFGAPLTAPRAAGVSVGDTPEHTFSTAPLASMGKTSLADMRGTPVLVEFWGTR
jgi:hypothetical protein